MTTLFAMLAGATVGLGIWIAIGAVAGWPLLPKTETLRTLWVRAQRAAATSSVGLAAATAVLVVTGWPVAAAGVFAASLVAPGWVGGGRRRRAAIERTEAIAAWTESVRDTMAAAAGLEEAITATATSPPAAIAGEVRQLAGRLRHQRLVDALDRFGDELAHPSADLVVAALTIAARMEAADLTGLLSRLAVSIRDDATMRIKIETSRSRLRTSAKIIAGTVAATVAMLLVLNRSYLDAYDSPAGQAALTVVVAIFATGGWLLARMSAIDLPDRFVPRRGEDTR